MGLRGLKFIRYELVNREYMVAPSSSLNPYIMWWTLKCLNLSPSKALLVIRGQMHSFSAKN